MSTQKRRRIDIGDWVTLTLHDYRTLKRATFEGIYLGSRLSPLVSFNGDAFVRVIAGERTKKAVSVLFPHVFFMTNDPSAPLKSVLLEESEMLGRELGTRPGELTESSKAPTQFKDGFHAASTMKVGNTLLAAHTLTIALHEDKEK